MEKKTFELSKEVKAMFDNKKFGLISKTLNEFADVAMNHEDPTEELLDTLSSNALMLIDYVFKGTTTVEKRHEDDKIYYKFITDGVMVFEYGIEDAPEESETNE